MFGINFKEKEEEIITNHVKRTIVEAKYSLVDLSLDEMRLIKESLLVKHRGVPGYGYGYGTPQVNLDLAAKIQL
jgi:hypothetical protein